MVAIFDVSSNSSDDLNEMFEEVITESTRSVSGYGDPWS